MDVGIIGAGAIAMGYAGLLRLKGREARVWSPSGVGVAPFADGALLELSGAIETKFEPDISSSLEHLSRSSTVVLALPANGHKAALDRLAPLIRPDHTIIISGHLSFAALYMSKVLAARGITVPVIAWNTTALTCKQQSATHFKIGALRKKISMSVVPSRFQEVAIARCTDIFGDCFEIHEGLLNIMLSNLNPQSHLAIALCNLTRIERGEIWGQNTNTTASVHRLLDALDSERLQVAAALGISVRSRSEQRKLSQGTGAANSAPGGPPVEPIGPKHIDTRYVLEDVPFGLFPLVHLAKILRITLPLHESGIRILSACYGRDLAADNDMLMHLDLDSVDNIKALAKDGYSS